MTDALIRNRREDMENPCENQGRDWMYESKSQGRPGFIEKDKEGFSPEEVADKKHSPDDTSILYLYFSELRENKILLF